MNSSIYVMSDPKLIFRNKFNRPYLTTRCVCTAAPLLCCLGCRSLNSRS